MSEEIVPQLLSNENVEMTNDDVVVGVEEEEEETKQNIPSTQTFFIYSWQYVDKKILLFGKQKEEDNKTVCISVFDVPKEIIYVEHNTSQRTANENEMATVKDVGEFLPCLQLAARWRIASLPKTYQAAPVVSFEVKNKNWRQNEYYNQNKRLKQNQNYSHSRHKEHVNGPDVPFEWNDSRPAYIIRKDKSEDFHHENLIPSPMHRAGGGEKVFATRIELLDHNMMKFKEKSTLSIPFTNAKTIHSQFPTLLNQSYKTLRELRQIFPPNSKFTQLWPSSITPLENFVAHFKLYGPCWMRFEGLNQVENSFKSNCVLEYDVSMHSNHMHVLEEDEVKNENLPPQPFLNILWLNEDNKTLSFRSSRWNGQENHLGSFTKIPRTELETLIKESKKPTASDTNKGKFVQLSLNPVVMKLKEQIASFFEDINIVVVYKWNEAIQKTMEMFQTEFALSFSRSNLQKEKEEAGACGVIWCDAFTIFNHKELFVRERSQQLGCLASIHASEAIKSRLPENLHVVDSELRQEIVYGLFQKFAILNSLLELSKVTCTPFGDVPSLYISELIEWKLTMEYVNANFILRQPPKSQTRRFKQHQVAMQPQLNDSQSSSSPDQQDVNLEEEEGGNPILNKIANITGGLVLPASIGVHLFAAVLDFRSQYSRIIQSLNLCFSTFKISTLTEFQTSLVELKNLEPFVKSSDNNETKQEMSFLPEKDAASINNVRGVIADVSHRLMELRQHCQEQAKSTTNSIEKKNLEVRSRILKFVNNSIFGNLWFSGNRFYSEVLAQIITAFGRLILQHATNLLQSPLYMEYPLEIIGGITDSLFVKAGTELQSQLHRMIYPIDVQNDKKTHSIRVTELESKLNDPSITEQQYNLFEKALKNASDKISRDIPGITMSIDKIALVMALPRKHQYAMIPLNKNFLSISQCEWKGFTLDQMGIAKFVLDLRPEIMFDLMTLFYSSKHAATDNGESNARILFLDRLAMRIRNLLFGADAGQMTLEEFKIVQHINRNLPLYREDQLQGIPLQVQLGHVSNKLWREERENEFGEFITKGDCMEYVMCHDFTVPEGFSPVLFHFVDHDIFQIHIEWYFHQHMVSALFNLLSPFNVIAKDDLSNFVKQVFKEIDTARVEKNQQEE